MAQQLCNSRITTSQEFTHVNMTYPKCKLDVLDKKEFQMEYATLISNGNKECGIGETSKSVIMQLVVDVDIKKPYEGGEINEIYTKTDVEKVIEGYQKSVLEIFEDITDEELTCVLMEKSPYIKQKNTISNGFHLHFPYLYIKRKDYQTYLFPHIREYFKENKICEYADIDAASFKNIWLMYGSVKEIGMEPYGVTKIYDYDMTEIDKKTLWDLVPEQYRKLEPTKEISYWYPMIFSLSRENVYKNVNSSFMDSVIVNSPPLQKKTVDVDYEYIEKLVEMLDIHRAIEEPKWKEIGWVIYNITVGSDTGLMIWKNFSKKCASKYDEHTCNVHWESRFPMRGTTNFSIGTLRYLAKQDNPLEYETFIESVQVSMLQENIDMAEYDIAKIIYEEYKDTYRCANLQAKLWYEFKQHRWHKVPDGSTLRKRLSTEVYGKIDSIKNKLLKQIALDFACSKIQQSEKEAKEEDIKKKFGKVLKSLKTNASKTSYMKEAADEFFDVNFVKELDSNSNLIVFKNGVYDLELGFLRDGMPSDMLSLQIPHNYVVFDKSCAEVRQLEKFLYELFPDPELRQYVVDSCGETFVGGNKRKQVQIWTGFGDNGKSVFQTCLEKMFGPYAVKFPTSLITGKRTASSSACPELSRAGDGVRWAVLQEPDHKDQINVGILKELSGNDSFFARGLYEAGEEKNPMFKLVLICNHLPSLPADDQATWNRIRVIDFESKFVNEVDLPVDIQERKEKKLFAKDPNFDRNIPKLIPPLIWYLLKNYERTKLQNKIHEPAKVTHATNTYRQKQDILHQFIADKIEHTKNSEHTVKLDEFYNNYKEYLRTTGQYTKQCESVSDVQNYLEKEWGKTKNKSWSGRRYTPFKNADDIVLI